LKLSRKRFFDTLDFCSSFKVSCLVDLVCDKGDLKRKECLTQGPDGEAINLNEQKDANEFAALVPFLFESLL